MSPELPRDWGGGYSISHGAATRWETFFNATIPSSSGSNPNDVWGYVPVQVQTVVGAPWLLNEPITGVVQGCNGRCRVKVRAPALAVKSCHTEDVKLNCTAPKKPNYSASSDSEAAAPLDRAAFLVSSSLVLDARESMNLVTGFSEITNCIGTLHLTACDLRSAIGEYDVAVQDNAVIPSSIHDPQVISIANNSKSLSKRPSRCQRCHNCGT